MKLLTKQRIRSHGPDRAPLCGFVAYVHGTQPILLRRIGYEVSNDIHDDFTDQLSTDNGRTWSKPRRALSSHEVPGGHVTHTENAVYYVPERDLLVHWTNDKFEASLAGGHTPNSNYQIRITVGKPDEVSRGTASDVTIADFGLRQGLFVSFLTPVRDRRGRLLIPTMWLHHDADGALRAQGYPTRTDMPDVMTDYADAALLIGTFQPDGKLTWQLGQPVPFDPAISDRGLCEPTVAELPGGVLVMIMRGSNCRHPERPGYKWLTRSTDGGLTWSPAVPLPADDGAPIESSATGSALFRSRHDGQLYWIGNLCLEGERPNGNDPRSPLYIAQMQEEPFAIKRGTITVIDRAQPGEHPRTQHSNFKFYQDRETADIVLYLTRYGERGYVNDTWIHADLYEYRISLTT
jgi:hypothetical protein